MLPRSHNLRQISDMHFGVTSDIHNCFDISHNKSAGARRRPTRIAVWVWAWVRKVKSGDHTEWSYSIERLWVGGFSYLLWSTVAFEQDSAGVARQQRAKLTLCLTFVILRSLIIFELSYKGAEPHRSHTALNSKDHTFDKCSAWFPIPHSHSHPHLDVAWFFVSLPCPSGVCCFSAAFEACAVIAAICCPAQQHYLRVLDFCAKRS